MTLETLRTIILFIDGIRGCSCCYTRFSYDGTSYRVDVRYVGIEAPFKPQRIDGVMLYPVSIEAWNGTSIMNQAENSRRT